MTRVQPGGTDFEFKELGEHRGVSPMIRPEMDALSSFADQPADAGRLPGTPGADASGSPGSW